MLPPLCHDTRTDPLRLQAQYGLYCCFFLVSTTGRPDGHVRPKYFFVVSFPHQINTHQTLTLRDSPPRHTPFPFPMASLALGVSLVCPEIRVCVACPVLECTRLYDQAAVPPPGGAWCVRGGSKGRGWKEKGGERRRDQVPTHPPHAHT